MATSTTFAAQSTCRVIVDSVHNGIAVLHVPGSDYHLHVSVDAASIASVENSIGQRIEGTLRARALRIHAAAGGGQFIEPVAGEPRIIAGRLLAVDANAGTVLVKAAVPMLIEAEENRDLSTFEPGQLVTFYVESGSTFTPTAD